MAPDSGDFPFKRICVFCGSASGADPIYLAAARAMGAGLARRGVGLVYGGASIGLMTAAADAALQAGGEAIGVIPKMLLDKEVAHHGLTALHVVDSMHERKALMASLSDAFVALPGGIGTFEELFEVWTWAQLGAHDKPCGLLNTGGFYDTLLEFLDGVVEAGFLKTDHRALLRVAADPDDLIDSLAHAPHRTGPAWVRPDQT